jgi:hypothetical protein
MQNDAKADLLNYISSHVHLGEQYEVSVGLVVESKIMELISTQSEENIRNPFLK